MAVESRHRSRSRDDETPNGESLGSRLKITSDSEEDRWLAS